MHKGVFWVGSGLGVGVRIRVRGRRAFRCIGVRGRHKLGLLSSGLGLGPGGAKVWGWD